MCTVVVSLQPLNPVPLLILGVRDELISRPWRMPARHWPGSPLIGGLDEQAGGTWLAVHPGIPRVACVLNGRGEPAPPAIRKSRGELPLRAAAEGEPALTELCEALEPFDPFHLVRADKDTVSLLSWDGQKAADQQLAPGTHIITNAGINQADPRAEYFGPKFAASRPSGDPESDLNTAWGQWLTLIEGDGLPATDPRAIRVRKELPDGRIWGTTSVSLVALARSGLRYDFQPVPGAIQPVSTT